MLKLRNNKYLVIGKKHFFGILKQDSFAAVLILNFKISYQFDFVRKKLKTL